MSDGASLFYSYASRDETLRLRLEVHLSLLKREALLETWSCRQINAGQEWKDAVDANLNAADIILLLVSADFIASDYCWGVEMNRAIERHHQREAVVVPIILKPCDWTTAPFAKLQSLPDGARPVTDWRSRDKAWLSVVDGLRRTLRDRSTAVAPSLPLARPASAPAVDFYPIDGSSNIITQVLHLGGSKEPEPDVTLEFSNTGPFILRNFGGTACEIRIDCEAINEGQLYEVSFQMVPDLHDAPLIVTPEITPPMLLDLPKDIIAVLNSVARGRAMTIHDPRGLKTNSAITDDLVGNMEPIGFDIRVSYTDRLNSRRWMKSEKLVYDPRRRTAYIAHGSRFVVSAHG